MSTIVFFTALIAAVIGFAVLCGNTRRLTNQIFSGVAISFSLYHFFIYGAIIAGKQFAADNATSPVPWLRAAGSTFAFVP
ncbi:MAG: hypothetical protein EXS35_19125 [Pedosphaera sp.]|nr:hypothetical protein [Pedosphaera sp.]